MPKMTINELANYGIKVIIQIPKGVNIEPTGQVAIEIYDNGKISLIKADKVEITKTD